MSPAYALPAGRFRGVALVMTATAPASEEEDQDTLEWIPKITQWWVETTGGSQSTDTVHLPASVDTQTAADPTDPDHESDPDPLCRTTTESSWRIKSLAVLPLGWKPVCKLCLRDAEDLREAGRL